MPNSPEVEASGARQPPLLRVQEIETFYGNIQALKGVSFEVPEGSIVTLLGANGAGKSTTLKSISGLTPPTLGSVTFMDQPIARLPCEQVVRLGIAHVPEGRELFPELTVLENLKMGAFTRRDKGEIRQSLELRLRALLDSRRAALAVGGHPERRGAADVGHRSRADGKAETDSPRRALARAGTQISGGDLPHYSRYPGQRCHRPARRAKCQ